MSAPVPPQNIEAEESVLGSCLLSSNAIEAVLEEGLSTVEFYRGSHGVIFQSICRLHDASEPVDAITVANDLEKHGQLEQIGGSARIAELAALVPAAGNAAHYAGIVRETSALRGLIRAGQEITRLGMERVGDLDELVALAESAFTEAVRPSTSSSEFTSITANLHAVAERITTAIKTGQQMWGVRTGFPDLDALLTGAHPGQLIVIAARPGMGKSALAQNIAENIADSGLAAAFASLEMSKDEVLLRALSRLARISAGRLRTGQISPDEVQRFYDAVEKLKERQGFYVEDNSGITMPQLRATLKRLHRREKLSLAVVDYVQLMVASDEKENRTQQVSAITRGLKVLARELGIPIIALSQLNRQVEGREDRRPRLSDLRESGSLEQDADVVIFIYRDDYYNPSSPDIGTAEIIVAKNRMGERGTVKLAFVGRSTEFKHIPTTGAERAAA